MKLGIGAKAGLASGIIIVFVYMYIALIRFFLSEAGGFVVDFIHGKSYLVIEMIEGFYGIFLRIELYKIFFEGKAYFLADYGIFHGVVFPWIFSFFVLITSILLGVLFEILYSHLQLSRIKASLAFVLVIWLILGICPATVFTTIKGIFVLWFIEFQSKRSIILHLLNIVPWLLYGLLLGRFYGKFSEHPDASIQTFKNIIKTGIIIGVILFILLGILVSANRYYYAEKFRVAE